MTSDQPLDPYRAPQSMEPPRPSSGEGDSTGGLIPYKNGPALASYYLGIFSLIPCIGLALAIPAVILGVIGLQKARQNPAVKGTVHAWVGIVMGALCTLLWGGLFLMGVAGSMLG